MNKEKLILFFNLIIDYGPIIITVLMGAYAAFSTLEGSTNSEQMLQWVLAILLLITSTQLVDRFRVLRSTDKKLDQVITISRGMAGPKGFWLESMPDLRVRLSKAHSISISGVSLAGTSNQFNTISQERLKSGVPIRLLVCDPDPTTPTADIAAYRIEKHQDPDTLRRAINHALDNFSLVAKVDPKRKNLKIRLLPYPPTFGIWIIDYGLPNAEIWVEIYAFRQTPEPAFQLLPRRDGEWYEFFADQFEKMWSASREWDAIQKTYLK